MSLETATVGVLKNNFLKNNKAEAWRPATLLKKDSNVGALLWILRKF